MLLSIFLCASWPSVCLLWRNVYLGLPSIFLSFFFFYIKLHELFVCFGDWSFVSCFICKYFLPFWGLSFHIIYGFLCFPKVFKFNKPRLLIFVLIFITLKGGSKKILLRFMSNSVLPMFSSKRFIVCGFTFRSIIHFKFYF